MSAWVSRWDKCMSHNLSEWWDAYISECAPRPLGSIRLDPADKLIRESPMMDHGHDRDNIPTKTTKNRRPRRDHDHHKTSSMLMHSDVEMTLLKPRVCVMRESDGWLSRNKGGWDAYARNRKTDHENGPPGKLSWIWGLQMSWIAQKRDLRGFAEGVHDLHVICLLVIRPSLLACVIHALAVSITRHSSLCPTERTLLSMVSSKILEPWVLEPCDCDAAASTDNPIPGFAFFELVFEPVLSHCEAWWTVEWVVVAEGAPSLVYGRGFVIEILHPSSCDVSSIFVHCGRTYLGCSLFFCFGGFWLLLVFVMRSLQYVYALFDLLALLFSEFLSLRWRRRWIRRCWGWIQCCCTRFWCKFDEEVLKCHGR